MLVGLAGAIGKSSVVATRRKLIRATARDQGDRRAFIMQPMHWDHADQATARVAPTIDGCAFPGIGV